MEMEIRISGEWERSPCPRPVQTSREIRISGEWERSRCPRPVQTSAADYALKEIDPTITVPPGAFQLAYKFLKVIREESPLAAAILFGGDRWSCVTDVIVGMLEDAPIGMVTISEVGEQHDGHACILGMYTRLGHRGKGYGKKLIGAAVEVGKVKGITPLRCDIITTEAKFLIETLPDDIKESLEIRDFSSGLLFKM